MEVSSDYRSRRGRIAAFNATSPIIKRGIALTPVMFGISFTLIPLNQATALVHVYSDGSIHLNHGGTEMGQGLFTKVAQIVAEEFGVPLHFVRITATNTAKVPNASPTAASSGTDLNGMAAKIAAGAIRERMTAFAASSWNVAPEAIEFRDGRVFAGNISMGFGELAKACRLSRVQLSHAGYFKTPEIHWDRLRAKGRPFYYFAYGAACSEVAIDTLTGEMRVLRADLLHDVGASINPGIDMGQVEGAFIQGMGWLTTEELVYDAAGTADDACARDLQDPGRLRHAADLQHPPLYAPQSDAEHLPLEGGRRAALDARNFGLFRDPRRGACDQSRRAAEARSALHAGIDPERHRLAERGGLRAAAMRAFRRLIDAIEAEGLAALVTLARVEGSSPREAGARMVVRPSGGFHGTIGGGALEWAALDAANAALKAGRGPALRRSLALGPELAQCCGGRVEWRVETFDTRDLDDLSALAIAEARRPGDGQRAPRAGRSGGAGAESDRGRGGPNAAPVRRRRLDRAYRDQRPPGLSVRRRPRRARAGAGAGAAAVRGALDRFPARRVSGACARERRARSCARAGRGARRSA